MKVFIATGYRVVECNGRIFAKSKFSTIIQRYYNSFGKVVLCSRYKDSTTVDETLIDISEYIEDFIKISSISKLILFKYDNLIKKKLLDIDLVIARCPSPVAFRVIGLSNKKYLAEVMGCPWDAYWNHGLAGKLIAPYMFFRMRNILKKADYAIYVTEKFLQKRYPCSCKYISASNVNIIPVSEDVIKNRISKLDKKNFSNGIKIMTSAAIDVKYKGQQYVIKAVKLLKSKNIMVDYYLAGGGDSARLKRIAEKCGISDKIHFLGEINSSKVIDYLDKMDIYIQPSLQEGLPRSVIEAMSRGCAVIGTNTAGIPELIQESMLVKRKNAFEIASVIESYIYLDNKLKESLSKENFNNSKKYTNTILDQKRKKYFEYISETI